MKEDLSALSARCNEFVSKLRDEQAKEEARRKEEEAKREEEERKRKEEEEKKREEEEKRKEEAKRKEEEEKERQRQEEVAKRKKEMEKELARQEAKRKMEEEERERQRDAMLARQKAILETLRIQKEEEEKKKKEEEEEEEKENERKQEEEKKKEEKEEEEKKKKEEVEVEEKIEEEEKKGKEEEEEKKKQKEEEEEKEKKKRNEEDRKKKPKEEEKTATSPSQSHRKPSLPRDDASEELREESFYPLSFTSQTWDAFLASETQQIAQLRPEFLPPRGLQSTDGGLWTLQDYSSFFSVVFAPDAFALCVYWHQPSSQRSLENLAFFEAQLVNFPALRVLIVDLSLFPQLLCQLDASPLSIQCFLFGTLVDSAVEDVQTAFLSFARSLDSRFLDYAFGVRPRSSTDPSEFRRRAIEHETFGIYPLMNEIATALDTVLQNLHTECADDEKEKNALKVGEPRTRKS